MEGRRNLCQDMTENIENEMHRRRIILEDGRYLIFYTFADEGATSENESKDESEGQRED